MSRNKFPPKPRRKVHNPDDGPLFVYGLHAVRAALDNAQRVRHRLLATKNGLARLLETGPVEGITLVDSMPQAIDEVLGADAVHQGVALEVDPLPRRRLKELGKARLLIMLDQVTDPHNVGAILRTACAFGADAVITTARYAPRDSGVLAKSASGALDLMPLVEVRNLGDAIEELQALGFSCIGFDSEADLPLGDAAGAERLAIVLGAEGKGLRQKTRELCDRLVRLDMPGPIKSLNVSNAAAIALYAATKS